MGADGGTVPKRAEQIKQKRKEERVEGVQSAQLRLTNCALSGQPLAKSTENLACDAHGNLFNLEAILESLVDGAKKKVLAKKFGIKKMKDIVKLKALMNQEFQKEERDPTFVAPFQCPFTSHFSNGIIKFIILRPCGHVMTHRALKEMAEETKDTSPLPQQSTALSNGTFSSEPNNGTSSSAMLTPCPICQKGFSWQKDVIEIVPQHSADGASEPTASPTENGSSTKDEHVNHKKRPHDSETKLDEENAATEEKEEEPPTKRAKVV